MITVGLTGGIGMGKSFAARAFRRARIPVFDADRTVHALQRLNGVAIPAIAAAFPGTVRDGRLDRAALRARMLADAGARRRLEAIVHPLVRRAERAFRARAHTRGARMVVLDLPLLFETGAERRFDHTVVVSAPAGLQRARLRRRGMSDSEIDAMIAAQMPDEQKRARADTTIRTGLSRHHAQAQVRRLLARLRA